MSRPLVVVFSGGGTGGHLYPALTLAGALEERRPDVSSFYVGAERGLEARVLPERGCRHLLVRIEGLRRGGLFSNIEIVGLLIRATLEVAEAFRRLRPRLVVVTGGYAGGPAGLAAVLTRTRLVLQEQNSLPGVTTRALAPFAREIHLAFPEAVGALPRWARRKATFSGNPIRPPVPGSRLEAAAVLGLDPEKQIVLVTGGSQGSRALNRIVLEAVRGIQAGELERPAALELFWVTGPSHLSSVEAKLEVLGRPSWVRTVGYTDEMPFALALAEVAVSRAGAMTTSEFLASGVPSILVPLPTAAGDHQTRNARALRQAGAAFHLPEDGASGADLWSLLHPLIRDRQLRDAMADAARRRGRPFAAREIAASLARLLANPPRRGGRPGSGSKVRRAHRDGSNDGPPPRLPELRRADSIALRDQLPAGVLHFVGIGGAGMCALAEAIVRRGGRVTGCDLAPGDSVGPLERLGVRVFPEHGEGHVEDAGAFIVSSAIPPDHPELAAAARAGIPVWKRAEALGAWVNPGRVVAVSGTHGKTTTTAMITEILAVAGRDPTGIAGGWVPEWNGHLRPGSDELFVVEADEYDRSFHHLRPSLAVVTNMDADHLDTYGDISGVRAGFLRFLGGVSDGGRVLLCSDDPGAASLIPWLGARARSFGFSPGSQLRGLDFSQYPRGSRLRLVEDGRSRGHLEIGVPGRHNAENALAAAAASRALGVEWPAVRAALRDFTGVVRRFQRLGTEGGVTVVDDYAHHPQEVRAALATARASAPGRRLVAVFQPHLYTRTRDFLAGFASALAGSDVVWITEIYPAREPPIPGVDGSLLARAVERAWADAPEGAGEVRFHGELESLPAALADALRPGDLCLTLGAGSIARVGPALVDRLRACGGGGYDR